VFLRWLGESSRRGHGGVWLRKFGECGPQGVRQVRREMTALSTVEPGKRVVRVSRRQDWNRARRTALDGQSTWRAERKAKDDRCSALGVQVALALQERDAWVAQCEHRAGQALTELVETEGLSAGEAVRWCAGTVTVADAARLRRLAMNTDNSEPEPAASRADGGGAP